MLQRLKCKLRKHRYVCSNFLLVEPTGEATLYHTHQCIACNALKSFPTETMPDAMLSMLQSLLGPQKVDVKVDVDPPTYIH